MLSYDSKVMCFGPEVYTQFSYGSGTSIVRAKMTNFYSCIQTCSWVKLIFLLYAVYSNKGT